MEQELSKWFPDDTFFFFNGDFDLTRSKRIPANATTLVVCPERPYTIPPFVGGKRQFHRVILYGNFAEIKTVKKQAKVISHLVIFARDSNYVVPAPAPASLTLINCGKHAVASSTKSLDGVDDIQVINCDTANMMPFTNPELNLTIYNERLGGTYHIPIRTLYRLDIGEEIINAELLNRADNLRSFRGRIAATNHLKVDLRHISHLELTTDHPVEGDNLLVIRPVSIIILDAPCPLNVKIYPSILKSIRFKSGMNPELPLNSPRLEEVWLAEATPTELAQLLQFSPMVRVERLTSDIKPELDVISCELLHISGPIPSWLSDAAQQIQMVFYDCSCSCSFEGILALSTVKNLHLVNASEEDKVTYVEYRNCLNF